MDRRKILIIDDDIDLAMITQDMLTDYGYEAATVTDSEAAFKLMRSEVFHLLLLDINLPGASGFEILQELRRVSKIPVIFASARTSEDDKITGLDIGGDDYLSKPYSLKELLSRVNALIRRTYGEQKPGGDNFSLIGKDGKKQITIHTSLRKIYKNGEEIGLSLKEFDLLSYLLAHRGQVAKKEELLNEVWGAFNEVESATVAVHIRWLREKLEEDASNPRYIKTVWGMGYIVEHVEADLD